MPHIIVQYRAELTQSTDTDVLKNLKRAIRLRASGELSVSERQLSEADFSFQFLKEGPDDELIKDVQVIILAHADEARVKMSDGLAESLGHAIEEVLANLKCYHPRELTYSVSLFLGEMGYHADGVDSQGSVLKSQTNPIFLEDIRGLELNVRPFTCLKRVGIETIGDLVAKSELELMAIPNFGRPSLNNVVEKLAQHALHLRQE